MKLNEREEVFLVLPYPPALNHLYFTARSGRRVLSERGRAYKTEVGWIARAKWRTEPMAGDVAVQVDVFRPRRQGDLDGALKAVLDALTGILYKDDRQVVSITARRFDDKGRPRVELTVKGVKA